MLNKNDNKGFNPTVIDVAYDKDRDIIHLLDVDAKGSKSLTNNIGTGLIEHLKDNNYIDHTPEQVFVYGTDGIITEYDIEEDVLKPVSKDTLKKKGHIKFIKDMNKRNQY